MAQERDLRYVCVCVCVLLFFLIIPESVTVFNFFFLCVGDFYECLCIFSFVKAIEIPIASYSALSHTNTHTFL